MEVPRQEGAQQESTRPRDKMEESVEVASAAKKSEQTQKSRTLQIHDPDDFLIHLRDILTRIHTEFYTQYDEIKKTIHTSSTTDIPTPDLKEIIPKMRQSILKGANILFTGVIPTNMPPERSREWNTARAFGATVHDQLIPGLNSSDPSQMLRATTHVVAAKVGTSKLREARRTPGMKIVNPRWLWSCAEQWRWVDERLFSMEFVKGDGEELKPDPYDTQVKKMRAEEPLKFQLKRPTHHKEDLQTSTKEDSVCKKNDMVREEPQVQPVNPMSGAATTSVGRHLSTESRLSVSDAELDKMEAEVDAELTSSSSDNENDAEQLGSFIRKEEEEEEFSYEQFTGEVFVLEKQRGHSRKRKHHEMEESGSSNSPSSNNSLVNLDESVEQSEEESENESEDELADLLG